jgi:hypothetical protein
MARGEEYRRYAKECLEMARTSEDPQVRAALLQMAQTWFRLADNGPPRANGGDKTD